MSESSAIGAAVHELQQLHRELDVADPAVPPLELAVGQAPAGAASPRCAPSSHAFRALHDGSSTSGHTYGSARAMNASPSTASPATGRALISAWSSHVRAQLVPVRLVRVERAAQRDRRDPRAAASASVRNTMPAGVGSLIVRSTARADSFGLARSSTVVHEQHVDVARVVQLVAAELAHADHGHRNRRRRDRRARRRDTRRRLGKLARRPSRRLAIPRRSRAGDPHDLASLPTAERGRRDRHRRASRRACRS